jgi:16S rRNA processing protein RimM
VRGEVRVRAFTEDPAALKDFGPLQTEDGSRKLEIEAMRPAKDSLVVRFAGISDRDAAAMLRNKKLYVARARLPEPEEETYYHTDLIGLAAVGADGTALGTVRALQNFGAGDLIEIAPADGGPSELVPFTKAYVPVVDIPGGRVVIERMALEPSPHAPKPSPLVGEGGERTKSASRVRGPHPATPLTRSAPSARTTLSRKGRG